MVDSFDFSDTETEFKRLKGDNKMSSRITPDSPPRTSHTSQNSLYNSRNHYTNVTIPNSNSNLNLNHSNRNNFYNENRQDHNYRTNNYFGIKKPANSSTFKPSIYRKPLPIRTSFSKNYKNEANTTLPKFSDFKPYKGRPFDAQGYRDPKYFDSSKRVGSSRNISRTFANIRQTQVRNNSTFLKVAPEPTEQLVREQVGEQGRGKVSEHISEQVQTQVLSPPNSLELKSPVYKSYTDMNSSYFRIKTINSYKEFCKIKVKGTIGMETIYETISFLKRITKICTKPIFLFFDQIERVFYGAAVVSLDEICEKDQIDTNTLESLIFRLNWIFLSEVEEETINFSLNGKEKEAQKQMELKDLTVNI